MKRISFLILFSCLLAVWVFAQTDLQPAATITLLRSEVITVKQFRTEVELMEKAAGRTLTRDERLLVLDAMINERLTVQAAERDKITITENEVNQQMQQFRSMIAQQIGRQPTDAEFNQALREQSGLEPSAFREQLRRQMIAQKYLMAKKENLLKSFKMPTEDEIRAEFNLRRNLFVRPETVRFSMIQVAYGPDAASRTRAKEQADRLVREIGSSASKFDEVHTRGKAPGSGYQVDEDYLPRSPEAQSRVGADFINTAFNLRQGEVSKLIEGVAGYQIIKITESHSMKSLELDDIVQPGTRITVREYIGQALLNQNQQVVLAQATQELVTELRAGKTFQIFERNLNW